MPRQAKTCTYAHRQRVCRKQNNHFMPEMCRKFLQFIANIFHKCLKETPTFFLHRILFYLNKTRMRLPTINDAPSRFIDSCESIRWIVLCFGLFALRSVVPGDSIQTTACRGTAVLRILRESNHLTWGIPRKYCLKNRLVRRSDEVYLAISSSAISVSGLT